VTEVMLTIEEQALADAEAAARYARRLQSGHKWNRRDDHDVAKERDAIGAELAVARVLDREWTRTDRPDPEGDVGAGVQVRHTRHKNGRLLLHPEDDDTHTFYLVTGEFPTYRVVGCILGGHGKRIGEWRELQPGRPAFAVEQSDLFAIREAM
jgi:hypothetical protein